MCSIVNGMSRWRCLSDGGDCTDLWKNHYDGALCLVPFWYSRVRRSVPTGFAIKFHYRVQLPEVFREEAHAHVAHSEV